MQHEAFPTSAKGSNKVDFTEIDREIDEFCDKLCAKNQKKKKQGILTTQFDDLADFCIDLADIIFTEDDKDATAEGTAQVEPSKLKAIKVELKSSMTVDEENDNQRELKENNLAYGAKNKKSNKQLKTKSGALTEMNQIAKVIFQGDDKHDEREANKQQTQLSALAKDMPSRKIANKSANARKSVKIHKDHTH